MIDRGLGRHAGHAPVASRGTVVLAAGASDAHTWNLVYLHLLLEEMGFEVVDLGPCPPDEMVVAECLRVRPVLLVVSSVNGHGHCDGLRLIRRLRGVEALTSLPAVIGGKLDVTGTGAEERVESLVAAGFDAVFEEGTAAVSNFRAHMLQLAAAGLKPAP